MTSAQKTFESSVFLIVRAKHEFVKFVQQEGIQWLQEVVLHNYFEAMTTIVILINIIVLLFGSLHLDILTALNRIEQNCVFQI